nr:unnamed protein product [Callosobruchus analis]
MKLFVLLMVLFVLYDTSLSEQKKCSPTYCYNRKFSCLQVECNGGLIKRAKPELCRCCPNCYQPVHEGGDCSNPWETVCAKGLKCNCKGICEK